MKSVTTLLSVCFLGPLVAGAAPSFRALEEQYDGDDDGNQGYGSTMYYDKCFQDGNGNDVVFFMMCPAQSGCVQQCYGGKEYIANLSTFVTNYLQAQLGEYVAADDEQQQANNADCRQAQEDCADDDACEMDDALAACEESAVEEDGDKFKVQKYTECTAFGDYFIGPYCKYYSIYLGLFIDNACTQLMDDDMYSSLYGENLPFSEASGVSIVYETCASCDDAVEGYQYQGVSKYDVSRCEAIFQSEDNSGTTQVENGTVDIPIVRSPNNAFLIGLVVVAVAGVTAFAYWIGYCLGPRSRSWIEKKKTLLSFESTDAEE